jgi:uncharacterized membrane protein YfcA
LTVLTFSILLLIISYLAGLLGALTGLGGGVVLIPVLVLLFHVNIHYAMGASLISVIATSSGTAIAYLREGYTNIRIGMFLEVGAVIGALVGAILVTIIPSGFIAIIFGLVLLFSAYLTWKRKEEIEAPSQSSHSWAIFLRLHGSHPTVDGYKAYNVQNVPLALAIMTMAGGLSGLLGIGSGALKVLAMDQAMRLPYKVATTTSNFIIGITAAVSAGVYFSNGYIDPGLTFPVMIGVLLGAFMGARILAKIHNSRLRIIFSIVVFGLALEMIYKGFTGNL